MGKKELVGVALLGGGYGLVAMAIAHYVGERSGGNLWVAVAVLVVVGAVGLIVGWRVAFRLPPDVGVPWSVLDAELDRLLDDWWAWGNRMEETAKSARGAGSTEATVRSAMARANEARACANDLEGVLTGLKGVSRD